MNNALIRHAWGRPMKSIYIPNMYSVDECRALRTLPSACERDGEVLKGVIHGWKELWARTLAVFMSYLRELVSIFIHYFILNYCLTKRQWTECDMH